MPVFAYTARELSGKLVNGTLEATSEREVAGVLADRSLFPVTVKEQVNPSQGIFGGQKKVKGQTMAVFYSQLASLLRAGVPMIRSLNVLAEQSSDAALKDVVAQIRVKVEDGEPIGDSMARFPKIFSEMACNMVRAGTEGGFLEESLRSLSRFTERSEDLRSRIVGAIAYPAFLVGMGTLQLVAMLV